jgi:acetyl-CoA carboxylase biotin carboxylase subunit
MFRRVLVANRGEVAARVISTCRRMGIAPVAVASEADLGLSYLRQAEAVVPIGGPRAYLDQESLIAAAMEQRCSALHPGWGFLSENPTFAARCDAARVTFVGPRPSSMRRMADKAEARRTFAALGLPPIPGTADVLRDAGHAADEAAAMGYPVLLKARSGGGGRGMRRVFAAEQLPLAFAEASAEAQSAFGDGGLYMERLILGGRHIEFQVMGDGRRCAVLGERECSVQRRNQKLIEESPAPGPSREEVARTAARVEAACTALGYLGAGTVEMLLDGEGRLWFMEMNTRLQVEHTVTEAVTGLDLVELQLRIAAHQRPELASNSRGHAIECRINAESPADNFRPTPGRIERLVFPSGEGVRVDSHLAEGDRISPHYDSMIAKLICWGPDRPSAIHRMDAALEALVVEGVSTTAALHRRILAHPDFQSGKYDNGFVERHIGSLL